MNIIIKEKFAITGRGNSYTLSLKENNLNMNRQNLRTFLGQQCNIENTPYIIKGVEAQGVDELNDTIAILVAPTN